MLSTVAINTTVLDGFIQIYGDDFSTKIYLKHIHLLTMLILTCFLIVDSKYAIVFGGKSERKEMQLSFAMSMGIIIIVEILMIYYKSVYYEKMLYEIESMRKIKAENNLITASDLYYRYGIIIEYFDVYKNKLQFEPSKSDIEIIENKAMLVKQQYLVPFYLVITFLMLIFSYSGAAVLANKKKFLEVG